jgi:hypothetical protein
MDLPRPMRYVSVTLDGQVEPKAKVPGRDLANLPTRLTAAFPLAHEVIGIDAERKLLVRWSSEKPVKDLSISKGNLGKDPQATLMIGKTRAAVRLGSTLRLYDGNQLLAPKAAARLSDEFSFVLSEDDTLYVATKDGSLLIEDAAGNLREEKLPAFGTLTGPRRTDGTEVSTAKLESLWLVVSDKLSATGQAALYRRASKAWEPVLLPAPPFGSEKRGPTRIDAVTFAGPDDVFVTTSRAEKGWGWAAPATYRAVYRTKRPTEVLRCQDVVAEMSGAGLWSWPPAATAECKTPFVVVQSETGKEPAKDYPALSRSIQGKTEFGESLTLVNFEGRGKLNLGITMLDTPTAQKLATHLSQAMKLRVDVVCGHPTPTREFSVDVKTGKFAIASAGPRL